MPTDDRAALEQAFPGLRGTDYKVTSPETDRYNCIAFAAGDQTRRWWPHASRHWPEGVPMEETVAAFEEVFAKLGYESCATGELEPEKDKVVLYVDTDGKPTHMARQRLMMWHSKLGDEWDIVHELRALEGVNYGTVHAYFARPSTRKRDKNRAKEQRKAARRK